MVEHFLYTLMRAATTPTTIVAELVTLLTYIAYVFFKGGTRKDRLIVFKLILGYFVIALGVAAGMRYRIIGDPQSIGGITATAAVETLPSHENCKDEPVFTGSRIVKTSVAEPPTTGMVEATITAPGTYGVAVLWPFHARVFYVQNAPILVGQDQRFSTLISYGGVDRYHLFIGVTQEPTLFREGDTFTQLLTTDTRGCPIHWIGPTEVIVN